MPVTTEQAAVLMEVYKKQQYLGSGDVQSLITKTGLTSKSIRSWFRYRRRKQNALKAKSTEESSGTYASDTIMAMKIETREAMMETPVQQSSVRIDLESSTVAQPPVQQSIDAAALRPTVQEQGSVCIESDMLLAAPDAVPAAVPNSDYDESRIAVPASFLPSLRSLFLDRVARAPLTHLARLEDIPLESSWHHPDCPLLITCSNDLMWYSFDPKHLPDSLKPHESPLRYLDMLGRYMNPPYPPIDNMTLINLVLDDTLGPFKKAMGLLLLARLGMKC